MSGPDFDELVGDVPAEDRERLLRIHELLVAAGPPPELPPSLERPTTTGGRLAFIPRRRRGALLALAAALAAAAFGTGYFVADRGGETADALTEDFTLRMNGTAAARGAVALLVVYKRDDDGNWPMELTVRNLPPLDDDARYELYLTKRGRLGPSCGTFSVDSDKAIAHLNAPYKLKDYDGWVIVREGSQKILVRTEQI